MRQNRAILSKEYTLHEYLRQAAQDDSIVLSEDDWKHIGMETEQLWPQFRPALYAHGLHPSDTELRICWLIRMNLTPIEMSVILKKSKSAISNIRSRLYEKTHGTKGSGRMFDDFIRKL